MKNPLPFFLLISLCVSAVSGKPEVPDVARLQLALKKLTVLGSVLYVGAHPDDENTAVLSYLSLGKSVRTGYLSLTRGDGGQNLLGPEKGDLLGVIRTEELLAAREVDDVEQFFTRAVDFGYTKSPEETIRYWGKENILSDIVWIIRSFRPDVVIVRFTKEGGGHGQHTASAILAEEAYQMAGHPSKFPEQLRFVQPWRPKRLVWNRYSFGGQDPSEQEKATLAKMEIGEYNAILGKSYSEIAGLTRSMHKSQGMGVPEERGKHINYFQNIAGDPAKEDVLEGVDLSWKRVPGGERVRMVLEKAYRSFRSENPSETVPALLEAYKLMDTLARDPQVLQQKKALLQVLMACSGMWLEAIAAEPFVIPGTDVKVNISALNRSDLMWQLQSVQIGSSNAIESPVSLKNNLPFSKEIILKVPPTMPYTQPYWLERQKQGSLFQVADQRMIGLPESPAPFVAKFRLVFGNQQIEIEEPVLYRWVDPVQGERYRTFEVLPEVSIHIKQPVVVFTDNNPKTVSVLVKSEAVGITGELTLKLPNNWSCDPKSIPFRFTQKNETLNAAFVLRPSQGATNGSFLPLATVGGKQISSDVVAINYEHFPPQTVLTSAEGILLPLDLKKSGQNIGYIMGSGDQVPESLEQAGYRISLLSDEGLVSSDLSTYDAIVLGIRAYNTRPQLMAAQTRLFEYVRKGGTMVVQYNTVDDLVMTELGPYPLRLSRDRVSVQDSPVTILATENPLLNFPNKITAKDFEGWVQERGLYFPDQWDPRYETLIACSDPGESPQAGGILYTHYGKGVYIYTCYSWFRELPAGVPGAYRLFVNLVSAGK